MTLPAATPAPPAADTDMVKTTLRLPPRVHAALTAQAEQNVRSLNQEMLAIITGRSDVLRVNG